MYDRERYDWETREDADTIKRYKQITSDPSRLAKAKNCILESVNNDLQALGVQPVAQKPGRQHNPATIMKLNK